MDSIADINEKNLSDNRIIKVTQMTLKNGKTYALCSDGNLYEESEENELKLLDDEKIELIRKIIIQYIGPKTDVINDSSRISKQSEDERNI